ncbi:MAG: hypothetical protein WBE26_06720 [Phycisphaerae bacterium]
MVFRYTAEQAIKDGVVVPASPDTHPNWLFTRAVFEAITKLPELKGEPVYGLTYRQRVVPLLQDVAMIASKHAGDHIYAGDELYGNLTGRTLWFAMNDLGGITIMFPEDY